MGTLSHADAKRFYDRLGSRQDWQAFYEDPAVDAMIAHARFETAAAMCEFGCGTGRLAARLLAERLPPDATYLGLDISDEMTRLATARLAPWATRARVLRTEGPPMIPLEDRSIDRFVSTYVLDLLSEDDIAVVLAEAHRVLTRGGLLCLVGLTFGTTRWSRAVTALWQWIHARRPQWLGGCRPVALREHLDGRAWQRLHHGVLNSYGICSEFLVAAPRHPDARTDAPAIGGRAGQTTVGGGGEHDAAGPPLK